MRIIIGSTNPVKCNAARSVLERTFGDAVFEHADAPSGVAPQPWGDAETRRGAHNRACAALRLSGADLAVGLEGGVQETEFGLMTSAWCALVGADGRVGIGGNACVLLPESVARVVRQGTELGPAIDALVQRHNTRQHNGAIGILTNDLETRQSAYETIIRLALAPFQNPDWYSSDRLHAQAGECHEQYPES